MKSTGANWGNNPDNGKSTSTHIVMLADGPIIFKVDLQRLTAQSTMEAELMVAALTVKEAVFCSNMTVKLGFEKGFSSVPLYLENGSTLLYTAGNRTYPPRANLITLIFFCSRASGGGQDHHPLHKHPRINFQT